MSLLKQFRRWFGESRRNQLLAASVALVAGGAIALVGIVAVSGDGDAEPGVVVRTATPSTAATEAPARTPRRTATASPTPEPAETLAFLRDGDIWLINADGSGEKQLTQLGNVQTFSWVSHSELDVVAGEDRSTRSLVDLQGNGRELPFPPAGPPVDVGPYDLRAEGSWSADGTRYVVPVNEELLIFDRDGTEVQRIRTNIPLKEQPEKGECGVNVPHRLVLGPPVFSPDGQELLVAVFCDVGLEATNQPATLYQVSLEDGDAKPLGLSTNLRAIGPPNFSPDGLNLAQTNADSFGVCHGETTLFVANPDGANARQLTLPEVEQLRQRSPVPQFRSELGYDWSPTSDAIAASFDVFICDPIIEQVVAGLYILRLDGTVEEKLVDGETSGPAWSPSGQSIAYAVFGDTPIVRLLDLINRQVTDLAQGSGPAWQPQP